MLKLPSIVIRLLLQLHSLLFLQKKDLRKLETLSCDPKHMYYNQTYKKKILIIIIVHTIILHIFVCNVFLNFCKYKIIMP